MKVRLEDRLQHQLRRHLRHSVSDRRNAQRPLSSICLRDVPPPHRRGPIRACAQRGAEVFEEDARPRTARRRRASSHRRPPRRGSASLASMLPAGRHSSRCGPYSAWKRRPGCRLAALHSRRCNWRTLSTGLASAGVVGTGPAGHALALTCSVDVATAGTLRSARVVRRAASSLLWSPRTPAAPRSLSPLAYTSRAAATTAAQTGLSCSVPLLVRVLRPLPRRAPVRVRLRTGARRMLPSPRNDRLGSRIVNLSRLQASLHVAARVTGSLRRGS